MTATDARPRQLVGSWIGSLDDGLRSGKAILLLLMPWPLLAVGAAITEVTSVWWMLILWLVVFLVFVSSAGCVLSDVARRVPERGIADALLTGAFGAVMILLSLIIALLLFVTWMLGVAIVLYLSKIPLLGPIVYTVSLPIAIVGTGAAVVGILFFNALVPPAVWEGRGAIDATRKALLIVQEKLFETVINVGLFFTVFLFLVAGLTVVILIGASIVVPIALGIVYDGLRGFGALGSIQSAVSGGANTSAFILLLAVTSSMLIAAFLSGANALYLELAAGLRSGHQTTVGSRPRVGQETEVEWEKRKDQAKVVAGKLHATVREAMRGAQTVVEDAGARVRQGLHEAQVRAQELAQRQSEGQVSDPIVVCQKCGAQVGVADSFCGGCGNRLHPTKAADEGES